MRIDEIDELALRIGGRFKLTVLLQKRLRELGRGAAALVEVSDQNLIDIALEEIRQGKVSFEGEEPAEETAKAARKLKES